MVRKQTWILLAVFVVLLGATLLLRQNPSFSAANQTPTATSFPRVFTGIEASKVDRLEIKSDKGKDVVIQKNSDGTWSFVNNEAGAVDQGKAIQLISSLFSMNTIGLMDASTSLPDIGLSPASQTILISGDGGNISSAFSIGNATPTDSGFYVQLDKQAPGIVEKSALNEILDLFNEPGLKLETPTPLPATPAP